MFSTMAVWNNRIARLPYVSSEIAARIFLSRQTLPAVASIFANIRSIIHYHLPLTEDSFVHRNGRTARMDATGNVYTLYSPEEKLPGYINDVATPFELPEKVSPAGKTKMEHFVYRSGQKR